MKDIMVYLKTTETCNLNCSHCFTSGTSGRKIYWDHNKTIEWIKRLAKYAPDVEHIHLEFHGGEPFLVPLETMQECWECCNGLWPSMSWGATSNLTFKLTDEIIDFIKGPLGNRIATSWDPTIRFANEKQSDLWKKNVKTLIDQGVTVKLFVSVTTQLLNIEPIDLLKFAKDLGVKEMDLERLTLNGSATLHPEIFPTNLEQDAWFLKMYHQTIEHDARDWVSNDFLENILAKFETGFIRSGTFCRDCEEKLFTINADGTIAGCPNSAPEDHFGNMEQSIEELINSTQRINNIACERQMNKNCYNCEVFGYCGGDCHQLEWQNGICGAPKSLMKHLKSTIPTTIYINGEF